MDRSNWFEDKETNRQKKKQSKKTSITSRIIENTHNSVAKSISSTYEYLTSGIKTESRIQLEKSQQDFTLKRRIPPELIPIADRISKEHGLSTEYVDISLNSDIDNKTDISIFNEKTYGLNLINKAVQAQVIKSIIIFFKQLKEQKYQDDQINIYVKNDQLHITSRLMKAKQPFVNLSNALQVAELHKIFYSKFNNGNNKPQKATQIIQKMFRKLYQLMLLLIQKAYDQSQERCVLEEFDFLMFPISYIQKKHTQKGMKYKKKNLHLPIAIGGLGNTCYRFFRYIFRAILYYSDYLLNYIRIRRNSYIQSGKEYISTSFQSFQQLCKQWIDQKLLQIIKYQKPDDYHKKPNIDDKIQEQMKNFIYERVLQDFFQYNPQCNEKQYNTSESMKLYRWQKNFNTLGEGWNDNRQTLGFEYQSNKFQIRRVKRQGIFQLPPNTHSINFDKIIKSYSFQNAFNINQMRIKNLQKEVIENKALQYTSQIKKEGIFIEKNGRFIIFSENESQSKLVYEALKEVNQIENKFPLDTFTIKGSIGSIINLQRLNEIKDIKQHLDFGTYQKNEEIKKKQQKNKKFRGLRKRFSLLERSDQIDYNDLPFIKRQSLQVNNKKETQPYVLYRKRYEYQDPNSKRYYPTEMRFFISANGNIKIENVVTERCVKLAYSLKDQLVKLINQNKQNEKQTVTQRRQRLYTENKKKLILQIKTFSKDSDSIIRNKQDRKNGDKKYTLSWRKTLGLKYLPILQHRNSKPNENHMQCCYQIKTFQCDNKQIRRTLKVLTWNIWGFRYKEDHKQNNSNTKNMEDRRIRQIIDNILYWDPDFVFIQEGYALVAQKLDGTDNPNFKLFKQQLLCQINKQRGFRQKKYLYAQYNPDMHDEVKTYRKHDRNQRTIILSKFPTKFYNVFFEYKDQEKARNQDGGDKFNKGHKSFIFAQFDLQMKITNPLTKIQSSRSFTVLLASVHLKSGKKRIDQDARQYVLEVLVNIWKNNKFDMCILAGDFNSFDQPINQFTKPNVNEHTSIIGKWIDRLKNNQTSQELYIEAEDKIANKQATFAKGEGQPLFLDRVIFGFNNKELSSRFQILNVKEVGAQNMEEYQNYQVKTVLHDRNYRTIKTPSDHIGRFVQFSFNA